jgi:chromosome segregation ATPase
VDLFARAKTVTDAIETNVIEIDKLRYLIGQAKRSEAGLLVKLVESQDSRDALEREIASIDSEIARITRRHHSLRLERERREKAVSESQEKLRRKKLTIANAQRELRVLSGRIPDLAALSSHYDRLQSELDSIRKKRLELESSERSKLNFLAGQDDSELIDSKTEAVRERIQNRREWLIQCELEEAEIDGEIGEEQRRAKEKYFVLTELNAVKVRMNRQNRKLIASIAELAAVRARKLEISQEVKKYMHS